MERDRTVAGSATCPGGTADEASPWHSHELLGAPRPAAKGVGVPFDVVVTSERAGFYKPDPAPYQLALSELELDANEVLFVAGSGFDLIGTSRVGLDTYWHNRVGLARPAAAPPPLRESRSLDDLLRL